MDRNDHLHIMALIGETTSDVADRDGVYFFITDEISDTDFNPQNVCVLGILSAFCTKCQ